MSADAIFLLGAAIIGLVLGSFLNVVIHRLPKIMDAEWRAQCAEIEGRELPEQGRYNLLVPSSHCPGLLCSIFLIITGSSNNRIKRQSRKIIKVSTISNALV